MNTALGLRPTMHSLPSQFQDLKPFATEWALPTEAARNRKRLSARMEEIREFYAAILPRMDEIIAYLNQFPLGDMPEGARTLFYLGLSFMEVSPAVELFDSPDEPDVFGAARFKIVER